MVEFLRGEALYKVARSLGALPLEGINVLISVPRLFLLRVGCYRKNKIGLSLHSGILSHCGTSSVHTSSMVLLGFHQNQVDVSTVLLALQNCELSKLLYKVLNLRYFDISHKLD